MLEKILIFGTEFIGIGILKVRIASSPDQVLCINSCAHIIEFSRNKILL